jgi:hypothetical protein
MPREYSMMKVIRKAVCGKTEHTVRRWGTNKKVVLNVYSITCGKIKEIVNSYNEKAAVNVRLNYNN